MERTGGSEGPQIDLLSRLEDDAYEEGWLQLAALQQVLNGERAQENIPEIIEAAYRLFGTKEYIGEKIDINAWSLGPNGRVGYGLYKGQYEGIVAIPLNGSEVLGFIDDIPFDAKTMKTILAIHLIQRGTTQNKETFIPLVREAIHSFSVHEEKEPGRALLIVLRRMAQSIQSGHSSTLGVSVEDEREMCETQMNVLLNNFISSYAEGGGFFVVTNESSLLSSNHDIPVTEQSRNIILYGESGKIVIDDDNESSLIVRASDALPRRVPIIAISDIYPVADEVIETTDLLDTVFNEEFWTTADSLSEKLLTLQRQGIGEQQMIDACVKAGGMLEKQVPLSVRNTSAYLKMSGVAYEYDQRGNLQQTLLSIDSIDDRGDIVTECRGFDFYFVGDRFIPLLEIHIYTINQGDLVVDEGLKQGWQKWHPSKEYGNQRTVYAMPHKNELVEFEAAI
ncbi:MAG TPA: hypothetical protein PKD19_01735 [Candidatus Saccharibacteria bacterium]|mgnify:CR=1 FL=1|nr:hypothetical protein [Candidatus Saccharibacteria bacterium]HMR38337.1 hypothetical protein [Candidatus Saccharibacteria bacterium]